MGGLENIVGKGENADNQYSFVALMEVIATGLIPLPQTVHCLFWKAASGFERKLSGVLVKMIS